jgi:hypothetical protein
LTDQRWTVAALLLVATVHVVASWGHVTVYWGDYGKWLHEVERVAAGERLYSDVYWPQLPAAAWLLGAWGRLFGTDLAAMWSATVLTFFVGVLGFARFVRATGPHEGGFLLVLSAAVLAWAVGNIESAPLAMGAYTPSSALGGTLLVWSAVIALEALQHPSNARAVVLGILLGTMVLTKIDFWPPAAAIAAAMLWFIYRGRSSPPFPSGFALRFLGSITLTVAAGATLLVMQSGIGVLAGVATGFGLAGYGGSRTLPTPESFVLEATMTAGTLALIGVLAWRETRSRRTLRWSAVFAVISIASALAWVAGNVLYGDGREFNLPLNEGLPGALSILRRSRVMLQEQALKHALPLALPLIAILAAALGRHRIPGPRRNAVILLLATIFAARIRRGFHHVDWFNPLLEIPAYSMLLGMLWQQGPASVRRLRWSGGLACAALAIGAYWNLGRGAFTRRGWFPPTVTPRGTIRVPPGDGSGYTRLREAIDGIDPSGTRPVFTFGIQGGFAYFLERPNPTLLTQGFYFTALSSIEREWTRLAAATPPPILLDNPYFEADDITPGAPRQWGWKGRPFEPIYRTVERPQFDKLAKTCKPANPPDWRMRFTLYDCPVATSRPPGG